MNRKRNIHFDPTGAPGGEVAVKVTEETQPIPATTIESKSHWDQVSDDLGVKPAVTEPVKEEPAPADAVVEKAADDASAVADEENLPVPEIVEAAQIREETWSQVAIDAGITPPENPEDYDAFIGNIKADKQKEYERGKAEGSVPDPDKYNPDEREFMDSLKGGKKLVDFIEPLQKYNDTLSLPDHDLVELAYANTPNWTADMVADKMATLTPEQIEANAKQLRSEVKTLRTNEYNKIVESGKKAWDAEKARVEEKKKSEVDAIIAEIKSRKDFAGAKLEDQHLDALVRNMQAGKYEKILNTPKSIVNSILQEEFGEKRYTQLLKNVKKSEQIGIAKKLSNSGTEQSGSHSAQQDLVAKSHFEQVAEDLAGQKVTGRGHG